MNNNQQTMKNDLISAINLLYKVFARAEKLDTISFCECCFTDEEVGKLLNTDLKDLSQKDFENYIYSLFNTAGDIEDFQYFLPRIFELLCITPSYLAESEIAYKKLRLAEWDLWDEPLKLAIKNFLKAVWNNELYKDDPDINTLLCSIGQCEDDLSSYLDLIPPNAALIELLEANRDFTKTGELSNSFWSDRKDQMNQVISWFNLETTQKMIIKAYEQ
jgi:hypothetical protein